MPELPPPPPPPMSLVGVAVDALQRLRAFVAARVGVHLRGRRITVVAVAVVVCATAVGAFTIWRVAGGPPLPAPEVSLPRATPDTAAPEEVSAGVTGSPLLVHAAGAVARPGLYEVPDGSRIATLIDAAGGASSEADVNAINLAARLEDGQRVYVPRRGEVVDAGAPAGAGGVGAGAGGPATPLDLNHATLEQLDGLPGVGPSTAQAILDYRRERGRFRSVDDLLNVRGIGAAKLAGLKSRVRV